MDWKNLSSHQCQWNYILWNLIMEYYIHYTLSCQIIKYQEFFLFWNFSLIKRTCTFSLSIPFYSVLLGNSGILGKMLVTTEEVAYFVHSDFDRRKGFSLFLFPLPYSSFSLLPTRMTMAPYIIYAHNQCIIIIIIVIARHRNWDQKCSYQILPLTLECWQNHKIPLL